MKRSLVWWRWLWLLFGALLLGWYLRKIDQAFGQALARALRSVRLGPLVVAVVLLFISVVVKGRRLALLLRPRRLSTRWLTELYLASYAADNLLVSQAGIGSRVLLLRRVGVPLGTAVGSQVLDKLLEAISLTLLAVPLWPALRAQLVLPSPPRWFLWALAGVVFVGLLWGGRAARRWPLVRDLAQAARSLRHPPLVAEVVAWTWALWLLEIGMVLSVASAFRVTGAAGQGVVVLVLVSLAMLIPGPPANIGPFETAATVGYQLMGLAPAEALLAAVLYHLCHTVPVTLVGLPLARRLLRDAQFTPGTQ